MASTNRASRNPPEDVVLAALRAAPVDDEPTTAEDLFALAEGREAARCGDVLTTAELRRALER